mgnify:CR=1 FL=1
MLITAIEPRRKSLRALYLDGELAVNIDAQTLLSSRFQVGTEITDEELHELLAASDANRAKEKALYLIAHRDHSKKELVDKIRRTASQEAAEKAADRMEEIGLIDDRDYARRYASELFQRKYFARKRVEYELKQKGIDPDFIEELLEELEPEPVGQIGALVERKYLRALDDDIGYGDVRGFMGANCAHNWAMYWEGASVRSYTPERLAAINAATVTYNGKDIDRYKATQMQRAQERQIRADKRAFLVAKESGQKDAEKAAAAKLAASRAKMKDFLSQTGLQQYQLRESVPGFGRSEAASAAAQARK